MSMGDALLMTGAPGVGKTPLASPRPLLGTVLQAPHPWVDALKRRSGVEWYRLTERNRADLQGALLAHLGPEGQP